MSYAARFGVAPDIREALAAEDLEFRRKNRGKPLERLFGTNVYFKAYRRMSLDQHIELERWRKLGVRTVGAPPDPEARWRPAIEELATLAVRLRVESTRLRILEDEAGLDVIESTVPVLGDVILSGGSARAGIRYAIGVRNVFAIPPSEIHRVKVLLTLLEGRDVFRDPSF